MCEFKVFVEMCSECSFRRRTGLKESTWSGCVMGGGEGGAFLSSLQKRRDGLDDPWGMVKRRLTFLEASAAWGLRTTCSAGGP